MCRNSVVDTETRYGLDGPGIEFRRGRDIPHRPDRPRAHPSTEIQTPGKLPSTKHTTWKLVLALLLIYGRYMLTIMNSVYLVIGLAMLLILLRELKVNVVPLALNFTANFQNAPYEQLTAVYVSLLGLFWVKQIKTKFWSSCKAGGHHNKLLNVL